jgi:hypothetical protein
VCGELGRCGDPHLRTVAQRQADEALARSAAALDFAPDLAQLRRRHADYWEPGNAQHAAHHAEFVQHGYAANSA